MYSYHEKGKGSTKKHQQATSTDMLWIIEVIVSSKFIPRIKNKRKKGSHHCHNRSHIAHQSKWIFQTYKN